ncbi:MAG: glycoside hydrolase family 104 protein [Cyanobacteria bacterium SBLK]|nr:glycoside hydrolase family 104 protein [Cyanobacteria bacterium SBLK]
MQKIKHFSYSAMQAGLLCAIAFVAIAPETIQQWVQNPSSVFNVFSATDTDNTNDKNKIPASGLALENQPPEIKAFLDTIAIAEVGTVGKEGYSTIVFRGTFDPAKGHPFFEGGRSPSSNCAPINGKRVCSSASGRYQFLDARYRELRQDGIISNFSPRSQDVAAIYYLRKFGAYALIVQGKIDEAFCKVGHFWASLFCNDYNQNPKSARQLRQIYNERLQYWRSQ